MGQLDRNVLAATDDSIVTRRQHPCNTCIVVGIIARAAPATHVKGELLRIGWL
jgi:hypothetical protein